VNKTWCKYLQKQQGSECLLVSQRRIGPDRVLNSPHNWNKTEKTETKQLRNCFEFFFISAKTSRPWNVIAVLANHSRYHLFARQPQQRAERWCVRILAGKTFRGCFSVLFWLK